MSESGFEGKNYVITGAARGMGAATAKLLASRGANVSLCDVRSADLEQTKVEIEKIGRGQVRVAVVDIRDELQVNEWIAASVAEFGKLDGIVNVAGVLGKDTMQRLPPEAEHCYQPALCQMRVRRPKYQARKCPRETQKGIMT